MHMYIESNPLCGLTTNYALLDKDEVLEKNLRNLAPIKLM
jgi:hypothetical protein